jgi:hypothetical protein
VSRQTKGSCRECGDKVEDAWKGQTLCWTCHICRYILELRPRYQRDEAYRFDSAHGHSNATVLPETGNRFLDWKINHPVQFGPALCNRPTG